MNESVIPWQVKAIATIGIPAAIAIYLVFILANRIESSVLSVQGELQRHAVDSSYMIKQNDSFINQLNSIKQIMQQTCANTARTSEDRRNCFR
jgi:hypothetical protein